MTEEASVVNVPQVEKTSALCIISIVMSILAILLGVVAFFPCLGVVALVPAVILAVLALILGLCGISRKGFGTALILAIVSILLLGGASVVQFLVVGSVEGIDMQELEKQLQNIEKGVIQESNPGIY